MRRTAIAWVVMAAAAGCASRGRGPAWPRGHGTDGDGGESLAAHLPIEVAEIEAHEDDTPSPVVAPAASPVAPPAVIAPTVAPAAPAAPATTDDPPTVEEITIAIDD